MDFVISSGRGAARFGLVWLGTVGQGFGAARHGRERSGMGGRQGAIGCGEGGEVSLGTAGAAW